MPYFQKFPLLMCLALAPLFTISSLSVWAQAVTLSALPTALTIHPGDSSVPITVSVGDSSFVGPISITLTGVPSGINVSPLTLTTGSSGTLFLSASAAADQEDFPSTSPTTVTEHSHTVNVLAVAGLSQTTIPLTLTVSISNPLFAPSGSSINLPIVNINTNGVAIVDKTTDVPGTITITSANGQTSYLPNSSDTDNTGTFHLHGNSTLDMPKKAYHVKLNTSLDLLYTMNLSCPYVTNGKAKPTCDKSKSFVLLANYDDKTFLRDWSASALANAIPIGGAYLNSPANSPTPSGTSTLMPWAPHSLFVELYLNGVYEGNYQLIEEVKVDSHKVNINELLETDTTDDITGGYLVEIDSRQDEDFVWTTPHGVPLGLIDPDYTPEVPEQTSYISNYVVTAENALFSSTFTDPTLGWRPYFDDASAVNFYIVNDLMGNVDGGDMFSSDYFYKSQDNPLLYMGPIWDFDISSGNVNYKVITNPTVPWTQTQAKWYKQWFKDPSFQADVAFQWNALKNNGVLANWIASIPQEAATLQQSQVNNSGRWPMQGIEVWPNAEAFGTFNAEVAYLTNWLTVRMGYLDSLFNKKASTSTLITVPGGTLRVGSPVTLQASVTGGNGPTGSVAFLVNNVVLGLSPLGSGTASLTTSNLPAGAAQLQAVYVGDNNNALSTSAADSVTVSSALVPTITAISSSESLVAPQTPPTLTVLVVGNAGTGVPSGTIAFSTNGAPLGTASLDNTGAATFTPAVLPGGNNAIQAAYSGDTVFQSSVSSLLNVSVQQTASTTTVSSQNSSISPSQLTTLTATVSGNSGDGPPSRNVSFFVGESLLGTATLAAIDAANSTANFTLYGSQLTLGPNAITAVYSGDANYAASTSAAINVSISAPQMGVGSPISFGPVNVGTTAPVQTITYTFTSGVTLSDVSIVTAGAAGLDYVDGGTSTCAAGAPYDAGESCVISVAFTPSAPGMRSGAVSLYAEGDNLPLETWYLGGIGQSSSVTVDPGMQSTLGSLSNSGLAYGSVIDGAGNIYVVDHANSRVITLIAGSFTQTTLISSGLLNPTALALDGAGNLYVSDTGNGRVALIPNEQGTLNVSDISTVNIAGLGTPQGIATDGSGNLYVADGANGTIVKVPVGGGTATALVSGLTNPNGIAVDSSGNTYVSTGSQVNEYPAGGGSPIPIGSGYSAASGLAVDAAGEIFVADAGSSQIIRVAPGGASQTTLAAAGLSAPQGVAVDASGNVYISDVNAVYEVNRSEGAALFFANIGINSTSPPQTVLITDAGNQQLAFSNLAITSNFDQVASGNADCTTDTQLAPAGQCSIAVEFAPTSGGAVAGTLSLTDNALNVASGVQTVQLTQNGALIAQTITFPTVQPQSYGAAPLTLAATATSGLAVTYTVVSGPATITGYTLTLTGVGSVTVQASQGGNAVYSPATSVSQTFSVNPSNQTITFPAVPTQTYGASPLTLEATASSGLPVTYSVASGPGTIVGSTLTLTGAGTITVQASQAGNSNYSAATPVSLTVVVNPSSQTISFSPIQAQVAETSIQLMASSSSGLVVSYTVVSGPATASGNTLTLTGAGSVTVQASQAGNNNYAAAIPVVQSFVVNQANPTINFTVVPAMTVGTSALLAATASSALPVSFSSTTPTTCSVSGNTAIPLTYGTCIIQASVAGNNTYYSSSVLQSIVVHHANQTITFPTIPTQTLGTGSLTLNATASSGLPVSFASTTSAVCTVNGNVATFVAGGTCTIQAAQAGNAAYFATTVTRSFSISNATQTITFPTVGDQTAGTSVQLTATASSGLPITYVATPHAVCSIAGSAAVLLTFGTCTVQATQVGNASYGPVSVTQSFTVHHANQTITFPTIPTQTLGTGSLTLNATASSGLPVSFASTTSAVCTVNGNVATFVAGGTCTIQASQAGNAEYFATTVTRSFSISNATQTITFPTVGDQTAGTSVQLTATASSGLPITYVATPHAVCSIAGSAAVLLTFGTCTVQATQVGNASYGPVSVTQSFTVHHANQTITFPTIPTQTLGTGSLTLNATASSGLPVSFASTTSAVCTVNGNVATFVAGGTCTIQAAQAGNAAYFATTVTRSFSISNATQTITFPTVGDQTAGTSVQLTATASSGLPITYVATPHAVCSIAGSAAVLLTFGTCTVQATQVGNASYGPVSVTQSFTVHHANQTITFPTIPTQTLGTGSLTLNATASSGLPVSFASTTSAVCTVNGNVATFVAGGTCTIQASQAGNAEYFATTVTRSFSIVSSN